MFCNVEVRRATEEAEGEPANQAKAGESAESSGAHAEEDEEPKAAASEAADAPVTDGSSLAKPGVNSNGQKGALTGDAALQ